MIQKETTGMILRKLRGDRTQEEIAAISGGNLNEKKEENRVGLP